VVVSDGLQHAPPALDGIVTEVDRPKPSLGNTFHNELFVDNVSLAKAEHAVTALRLRVMPGVVWRYFSRQIQQSGQIAELVSSASINCLHSSENPPE
jgi:hypothetical protein